MRAFEVAGSASEVFRRLIAVFTMVAADSSFVNPVIQIRQADAVSTQHFQSSYTKRRFQLSAELRTRALITFASSSRPSPVIKSRRLPTRTLLSGKLQSQ